MTTVPAAYAQFGYTLAFAERTLTAVLREHLAERGTEPETWYALQLLATRGPALDRTTLSAGARELTDPGCRSARELLARLEAAGLIRGGATISLTAEGQALHRSLSEYIAAPRVRLLSQFSVDDIDTTVRTLQAIAERAGEETAGAVVRSTRAAQPPAQRTALPGPRPCALGSGRAAAPARRG